MVNEGKRSLSDRGGLNSLFGKPFKVALIFFAVALAIGQIGVFVGTITGQIEKLTVNSSQDVQWRLGQLEASYLNVFETLPDDAQTELSEEDMLLARDGFLGFADIVTDVANAENFRAFRSMPAVAVPLASVAQTVAQFQDELASNPEALKTLIPGFRTSLLLIGDDVHSLSHSGLQLAQQVTDTQRSTLMRLLLSLLALTFFLVAFLVVLIWVLRRMNVASQSSVSEIKLSRERTEAMVFAALDGIVVMDATGRLMDANTPAKDIFGLHFSTLDDLYFSDLLAPDESMSRRIPPLETGIVGVGRVRRTGQRHDGKQFPMELSIARTPTEHSGQVFVAYVRDISERIENERALLMARDTARAGERAKAELLAVMSHEFRTPLNGILGAIELVQKTKLSAKQAELISAMKTSGDILLTHVNDVLDLARLDSGKIDLKEQAFRVRDLVKELAESQNAQAESQGNVLKVNIMDSVPEVVYGDVQKIQQALLNLIGNAQKFTQNGEITIEAEAVSSTSMVEFRVIDTGIGIAHQLLDRIFDDFFAIDTSFGRLRDGTGLGLGITQRLVRALEGTIGAESVPGEGSLFWIRLPLTEIRTATPSPLPTVNEPKDASPMRILLVEDNAINRMITGTMLRNAGHVLDIAEDGETGVQKTQNTRYDLILMDISMPGMDGMTAARQIKSSSVMNANTPIVALTAQTQPEAHRDIIDAGISHILTKPATEAELLNVLHLFSDKTISRRPAIGLVEDATGVLNETVLQEVLQNIGPQKTSEHRDLFVKDLQQLIDTLESVSLQKIASKEVVLCREVHALSSAAAILGLRQLHTHFIAFELACETPETCDWDSWIARTKSIWQTSRDALNAYLEDHSSPVVELPLRRTS